ncbi:MAG: GTP cyclohydrolase II [Geminicoccaceae bacterium]|nr:GTP cyclohydrolase II [Geminicoccaceae bacterium]
MRDQNQRHWRFVEAAAAGKILLGGLGVAVEGGGAFAVGCAPEVLTDDETAHVLAHGRGVRLLLTRRRLAALDAAPAAPGAAFALALPGGATPATLRALADPTAADPPGGVGGLPVRPANGAEAALLLLAKCVGLLPAVLALDAAVPGLPVRAGVTAAAVEAHEQAAARSLLPVSEAHVPLKEVGDTRFVTFRSRLGGPQHHVILVGEPEATGAPLCRLHSECFTGDVFGSLRCDCGQQLKGALRRMAAEGSGVLLYLAQEGRGIGLANKLRAYRLQDEGVDTVDANTHLGFEPDERDFLAAAVMLERLGIERVRLLTNNPDKLDALARHGVRVTERVPHAFLANSHNRFYLETKARRAGHLLNGNAEAPDRCVCPAAV